MNSLQDRIAQFRKMANDDPDNELGHFRLGQLLMEGEQFDDACRSFQRALELSPQFSKVYQLLAGSLIKLNRKSEASRVLHDGLKVADERGDNMPRAEMAKLLVELGETPPEPKRPAAAPAMAGDGFHCQRPGCMAGTSARKLPAPPMNDELGKKIYDSVCAECWNYWLRTMSIKVINEMRLDLSTEASQEAYDQIMCETLGLK